MFADMKILVVDDEQAIREILQFNLETEGYEVDTAASAEEALRLPLARYDLLLLDVMMGAMSGFQLARRLKDDPATAGVPIIFITALDDENDIVKGLNIGADDYISKPLGLNEVKARVRAALRRGKSTGDGRDSRPVGFRSLSLDPVSKLASINGERIDLTKREFEILLLLLRHPNTVFSREELLARCWADDACVLDRTVDVNITRLRRKTGEYGSHIKTRVGYGYTFEI